MVASALRTTVADFVAGLKDLENTAITQALVLRYLHDAQLSASAISPYVFWSNESYTRNLIYRDELFEVLALCWRRGQKTPVHTHNGQLGWVTVLQGEILNHNYRYVSCSSPGNQNVVGIDCLAGSHSVVLDRLKTTSCVADGSVATVGKLQTIHQIENAEKSSAGSISLHIYSKPIDSCVVFDIEKKRCGRRSLRYHSSLGALQAA